MTVEGSSKRAKTTKYRAGTASYRAPEILAMSPKFTQKVDLWALGCIVYELVTCEKLFHGDHEIMRYAADERVLEMPIFPFSKSDNFCLLDLIRDLLSVDPNNRGSAEALIERFRQLPIQSAGQIDPFSYVTAGDEELGHVRRIGSGGFGSVYEVI